MVSGQKITITSKNDILKLAQASAPVSHLEINKAQRDAVHDNKQFFLAAVLPGLTMACYSNHKTAARREEEEQWFLRKNMIT